eukprot:g1369.t1
MALANLRSSDVLFELHQSRTVVGRSEACDLCVQSSRSISKTHCVIEIREEHKEKNPTTGVTLISPRSRCYVHILSDYHSTNGTFVNDHLIRGSFTTLEDGDIIRFGHDRRTYRYEILTAIKKHQPTGQTEYEANHNNASGFHYDNNSPAGQALSPLRNNNTNVVQQNVPPPQISLQLPPVVDGGSPRNQNNQPSTTFTTQQQQQQHHTFEHTRGGVAPKANMPSFSGPGLSDSLDENVPLQQKVAPRPTDEDSKQQTNNATTTTTTKSQKSRLDYSHSPTSKQEKAMYRRDFANRLRDSVNTVAYTGSNGTVNDPIQLVDRRGLPNPSLSPPRHHSKTDYDENDFNALNQEQQGQQHQASGMQRQYSEQYSGQYSAGKPASHKRTASAPGPDKLPSMGGISPIKVRHSHNRAATTHKPLSQIKLQGDNYQRQQSEEEGKGSITDNNTVGQLIDDIVPTFPGGGAGKNQHQQQKDDAPGSPLPSSLLTDEQRMFIMERRNRLGTERRALMRSLNAALGGSMRDKKDINHLLTMLNYEGPDDDEVREGGQEITAEGENGDENIVLGSGILTSEDPFQGRKSSSSLKMDGPQEKGDLELVSEEEKQRRREQIAARAMRKMTLYRLAQAFEGWRDTATLLSQQRRAMGMIIRRLSRKQIAKGFRSWQNFAVFEAMMQKAKEERENRERREAKERRLEEEARAHREAERSREVDAIDTKLREAMDARLADLKDSQRKQLQRILHMIGKNYLRQGFTRWRNRVRIRAKLESLLARTSAKRGKGWALKEFQHAVQRSKNSSQHIIEKFQRAKYVYKSFKQWKAIVQEGKRHAFLLRKAGSRLTKMKEARVMEAWKLAVEYKKVTRSKLRRAAARLRSRSLHNAITKWREEVEYKREARRLINRIIAAFRHAHERNALQTWKGFIRNQEMQELQDKVRKEGREREVKAMMARHLTSSLRHAWENWKDFVRNRNLQKQFEEKQRVRDGIEGYATELQAKVDSLQDEIREYQRKIDILEGTVSADGEVVKPASVRAGDLENDRVMADARTRLLTEQRVLSKRLRVALRQTLQQLEDERLGFSKVLVGQERPSNSTSTTTKLNKKKKSGNGTKKSNKGFNRLKTSKRGKTNATDSSSMDLGNSPKVDPNAVHRFLSGKATELAVAHRALREYENRENRAHHAWGKMEKEISTLRKRIAQIVREGMEKDEQWKTIVRQRDDALLTVNRELGRLAAATTTNNNSAAGKKTGAIATTTNGHYVGTNDSFDMNSDTGRRRAAAEVLVKEITELGKRETNLQQTLLEKEQLIRKYEQERSGRGTSAGNDYGGLGGTRGINMNGYHADASDGPIGAAVTLATTRVQVLEDKLQQMRVYTNPLHLAELEEAFRATMNRLGKSEEEKESLKMENANLKKELSIWKAKANFTSIENTEH